MTDGEPDGFRQLTADFHGVAPAKLRDASLVGGLLVAAAGAAGLTAVGAPVIRQLNGGGVAAFLVMDGCHVIAHAFPEQQLLMLDVLTAASVDSNKALDVFARRLGAADVRTELRDRGT